MRRHLTQTRNTEGEWQIQKAKLEKRSKSALHDLFRKMSAGSVVQLTQGFKRGFAPNLRRHSA
jgi:hypothetical protein